MLPAGPFCFFFTLAVDFGKLRHTCQVIQNSKFSKLYLSNQEQKMSTKDQAVAEAPAGELTPMSRS